MNSRGRGMDMTVEENVALLPSNQKVEILVWDGARR